MDVAVGPRGNSFITLFEPLRLCSQPNKQRTDGGGDDVRYLQHGRHMATTKKISFFLFPAPLSQICFVLVLISPNHKARKRYPEMVMARTETELILTEEIKKRIWCPREGMHCTPAMLYTRCFKMRLGEKLKRGV